jgi:hypothetical protein
MGSGRRIRPIRRISRMGQMGRRRKGKGQVECDLASWLKPPTTNNPHAGLFCVTGRTRSRGHFLLLLSAGAKAQSAGQNGHDHDRF